SSNKKANRRENIERTSVRCSAAIRCVAPIRVQNLPRRIVLARPSWRSKSGEAQKEKSQTQRANSAAPAPTTRAAQSKSKRRRRGEKRDSIAEIPCCVWTTFQVEMLPQKKTPPAPN